MGRDGPGREDKSGPTVATTRCFSITRSAHWLGLHQFLRNREPQYGMQTTPPIYFRNRLTQRAKEKGRQRGQHRPVQTALQDEIAIFCALRGGGGGGGQVDVGRARIDFPNAFLTRFIHGKKAKGVSSPKSSGTCLRYSWSHREAQRSGFVGRDHPFS